MTITRRKSIGLAIAFTLPAVFSAAWRVHTASASLDEQTAPFWQALMIKGSEVERFDSLKQMAASSNAVVMGNFTNFRISRYVRGDTVDDVVPFAAADLVVAETIRGRHEGRTIPVEFVLGCSAEEADRVVASTVVPEGEVIAFVRKKHGAKDGPYYRLVNSSGVWGMTAQGLRAPLAPVEESASESTAPGVPPLAGSAERQLPAEVRERRMLSDPSQASSRAPAAPHVRYASELRGVNSLSDLASILRN